MITLPGFVDGHCHLDKSLAGLPWMPHEAEDSVPSKIASERARRGQLALPTIDRARNLLRRMVAHGTTALRTHVDIDTARRLDDLEAILELRREVGGHIDIQVVAFPQSGILRDPGTADLLDAALAAGADLVGGLDPVAIDGDMSGHLDIVFGLAERHGKDIDIHLHGRGALGLAEIRDIAGRTRAAGLGGKVAVSHAFSLGDGAPDELQAIAAELAEAGVAVMTHAPGAAPMPPVKPLRAAGVEVFSGSDNIRDMWSPYGSADMLDRARLIGYRQNFRRDEDLMVALDVVSRAGRRVMGLPEDTAEVLVEAETLAEAVVSCPPRQRVVRGNRVLAEAGRALVV
jgi:cytosine deaminase